MNFCVACPQPGVNLPEGWEEDPDQYVQSFIFWRIDLINSQVEVHTDHCYGWEFCQRAPSYVESRGRCSTF